MSGQPPLRQAQGRRPLSLERSSNALLHTHNLRKPRHTLTRNYRRAPFPQRREQPPQPNLPKLLRTRRQIPPRPLHQRTSPHNIPRRMMMQRHRSLNQPLQESLLHPMRLPPHIFPNLVRVIELPRIEVPNPHPVPFPIPKTHKRRILPSHGSWRGKGLCGDSRPRLSVEHSSTRGGVKQARAGG